MTGRASDRRRAWGLGLVVVLLWGLSFPATRLALLEIRPLTLAFLRFLIALVVLWPLVRRGLDHHGVTKQDRVDLFLAGFLGVTLAFVLENLGLERTTASHGSLIVAIAPLVTALTEAVLGRRRPSVATASGLVLSLAGVALIVGDDTGGQATLAGDLLMLSTVAIWVIYGFVIHRLSRRHPVGWVTFVSILWGVATLLPLAAIETLHFGLPRPSLPALGALLFLGAFCSGFAYLWWNRCLQVLGVTSTNSLIYGIPLVAVLGGILLLGEPFNWKILVGGGLVIGGLLLAHRRGRRRAYATRAGDREVGRPAC